MAFLISIADPKISENIVFGKAVASVLICFLIVSLIIRSRRSKTPIWAFMAFTSAIAVYLGLLDLDSIGSAIDLDVILFLIGMSSLVGIAGASKLDCCEVSLLRKIH